MGRRNHLGCRGASDGEASGDGRWRAGLLLSRSRGDGDYTGAEHGGTDRSTPGMAGKVKAHLTGVRPGGRVRGRALLPHATDGFRDQGFSGSLSWRQQPDSDRGAMFVLAPRPGWCLLRWGRCPAGPRHSGRAAANDATGNDHLEHRRLELQLGYGLPAFGDRLKLTPEVGLGLYESGRNYRIGWNLTQPDEMMGNPSPPPSMPHGGRTPTTTTTTTTRRNMGSSLS